MHITEFLAHFPGARPAGPGQWTAPCPAHEDRSPSLSIGIGLGGRRLLHCHAACSLAEILAGARLVPGDLFGEPLQNPRTAPGSTAGPGAGSTPVPARPTRYAGWHEVWLDACLIGQERLVAEEARRAANRLPDPDGEAAWGLRALAAALDASAEQAEAEQEAQLRARHDRKKAGPRA